MKVYNIVLVGCGYIGERHLDDIYYRDNVKVLAVVDLDIERARLFARKYGAAYFGEDYRPYVSLPETDIVIVATNVNSHYEITAYSLAHGKHVICEKPIAVTVEEGKRFCDLVGRSSSKVIVAHILRHNKSYQTIRALIKEGTIGDLRLIRIVQNHHAIQWPRYQRLLEDCAPVTDCGVHYFDLIQWLSDSPIVSVAGCDAALDDDCVHKNYDMVFVKTANGCAGVYESGWSKSLSFRNEKEFIGTTGRIRLTLKNDRAFDHEEGDLIEIYSSETGEYKTVNVQAPYRDMYAQLSSLIDMIENDAPPVVPLDEVLSSFNVAKYAEIAMREKKLIEIPAK